MNRDGAAGKGGNSRGLVLGLLLGVLLGGLLLAPKARAPVVAQLKKTGSRPPLPPLLSSRLSPRKAANNAAGRANIMPVLALAAEMALKELQTSYDKIKADSDAAGTQLKAEMDVLKADAKKAADQLKECQDKNGGSVMKQKVSVH